MRLFPIGTPGSPPSVGAQLRGVAIHWLAPAAPVSADGQKFRPQLPEASWHVSTVPFDALTLDGSARAPRTTVEQNRMVHRACAIVSVQNPIPSTSPLYYEVGTWTG